MSTYACVYCRVSSSQQQDGVSLQSQSDRLSRYVRDNGLNIRVMITEIRSAYVRSRNSFISILNGAKHLVVADVSRLSRRVHEGTRSLDELVHRGVTIHFVDDGIVTRPGNEEGYERVVQLLRAAERESERIGTRIRLVKAYNRSQGRPTGGLRPFGMCTTRKVLADGRSVPVNALVPHECNVVKFIDKCRSNRYSGRELTVLMREISIYEHAIETICDDEVSEYNTIPMSAKDIADLLNDYSVLYRGSRFTAAIVRNIKSMRQLIDMLPVEDQVNNVANGLANVSLSV
jgi:DNA invertase Pin-like site-specific DNA recombinase